METFPEMTARFESKARQMSTAQIFYALQDLKETMKIHRDAPAADPYARKLQAEWDAMITEYGARRA